MNIVSTNHLWSDRYTRAIFFQSIVCSVLCECSYHGILVTVLLPLLLGKTPRRRIFRTFRMLRFFIRRNSMINCCKNCISHCLESFRSNYEFKLVFENKLEIYTSYYIYIYIIFISVYSLLVIISQFFYGCFFQLSVTSFTKCNLMDSFFFQKIACSYIQPEM